MGWFQDAHMWPKLLASSSGRDKLLSDIKHGEGVASMGSPLHGLTAGFKAHELMSPTVHINDRIHDLRKNGSDGHINRARDDYHHYVQDGFKENWPVIAAFAGGFAGGAGGGAGGGASGGSAAASGSGGLLSAGDAAALEAANISAASAGTSGVSSASGMGMSAPASGFNWGQAAQQGLGLLGQASGQGQQQPTAVAPPPQQGNNQSLQQQMARTRRLQQLRAKPRKTLAEQQELQELMRNNQGQM
jgi:hypothetical protein